MLVLISGIRTVGEFVVQFSWGYTDGRRVGLSIIDGGIRTVGEFVLQFSRQYTDLIGIRVSPLLFRLERTLVLWARFR